MNDNRTPRLAGLLSCYVILAIATVAIVAAFYVKSGRMSEPSISVGVFFPRVVLLAVLSTLGVIAATLLARSFPSQTDALAERLADFAERRYASLLTILSLATFASVAYIAVAVLEEFPNSGDEYAYVFQAQTYAQGRLWNEIPREPEFFTFFWNVQRDGKWVGMYPLGWPAMLTLAIWAGLPLWTPNALFAVASVLLTAAIVRRAAGKPAALASALLLACTAFFLFNAGSLFSHLSASAALLLFCYCGQRYLDGPNWRDALIMGAAAGAVGLIREYTCALAVVVFLAYAWRRAPRRTFPSMLGLVLGGLPFLAAMLYFNEAITGDWLLPPRTWGFPHPNYIPVVGMIRGDHTVKLGAMLTGQRILELADFTSPMFLIVYGLALIKKTLDRRLTLCDWILPVLLAGYALLYFSGGNRYGPRYVYEGFPLGVVTMATAIPWRRRTSADDVASDAKLGQTSDFVRRWWIHAGLIALITALVYDPFIAHYNHLVVRERQDLYDQVAAADLHHAVVIVRSSVGKLRPMDKIDLAHNGLSIDGDVIYAIDHPPAGQKPGEAFIDFTAPNASKRSPLPNERLKSLYPDRAFYYYDREPAEVHGKLTRWE